MTLRYFAILTLTVCSITLNAQTDTSAVDSTAIDSTRVPLISSGADLLESESQSQDISGLLQSSKDVYTSTAGFNFSAARFRLRGYSSENTNILMGGIPASDPESGWTIWSYWGGLNDITRYPETKMGISSSHSTFGGIGGYSSISLRASEKRKGHRFSYASTNRTYTNRAMYTYSSGWKKDWAFTVSGSARWANEGYVEGTSYSGGSYFLAVERRINKNHTINLAGFGAPTVQGRRGIAVQEVDSLTGNNFYNPYWGYQTTPDGDSVKRNARMRDNHKPYIVLTDYLTIDDKSKLTTSVYAVFGRTSNTNLNWYDAADPRPDYYKKLPSYYTSRAEYDEADAVAYNWQNNTSTSQLNWDQMYFANGKNLYTVENVNGTEKDSTGNRSKYIVEEYRVDPRRFGINSVYNRKIDEKKYLSAGVSAYTHTSRNYRLMTDLLGGDFWVDVDQFAERDFSNDSVAQNDLSTLNKLIKEGDVFGYDYNIHVNKADAFGQMNLKLRKIDAYAGATVSYTSFWRTGNVQNGRFPEESEGDSEKNNFFNYGIKAGAVYKITGRHHITGNLAYLTRAPFSRNAFISPRTRDQIIDNLTSTKIMSGDLSYIVRYPTLKIRATGYYTKMDDQVWARSFYHDDFRTFVNYMMTNVDQLFTGIEFGLEKTIAGAYVIQAAATTSQSLYNSRPNATITRDNSEEVIAENRTIYLKNYRIGGMPQTAASIGFKYNAPKYWYVGTNFNYFADIYLDPNPDRRTEEALAGYVDTDPQIDEIIDQEKLENGYTLNLYGGKSWKIRKNNSFIRLNVNVNNLLNNTSFQTGGYEQLRYDVTQINKFPPKYGYMYGLTYFAMVSYLF